MDPITAFKTLNTTRKVGKVVYDFFSRGEEQNTKPFRETAAEEFLSERAHAIAAWVERVEDTQEVHAELVALLTDEFAFLQKNYEFEAIREARKERRRMLAYAAAGAFNVNLQFSDSTRVERALRSLEPEDVLFLAKLADIAATEGSSLLSLVLGRATKGKDVSRSALASAGCLNAVLDQSVMISPLGMLLLSLLSDYIEVRKAEGADVP